MSQKEEKRPASVGLEEFKALVKNLVPATLEQAEWIWSEVERLTRKNPELKKKLEEWCKMPESEEKELIELINRIITEEEKKKLKEERAKRPRLKAHCKRTKHGGCEGGFKP